MNLVILGLSITSSWGNGHATVYRALVRALRERGHDITFLERNQAWYASHRDQPRYPYCQIHLYNTLADLRSHHAETVRQADAVVVGSFVPEGTAVGEWVLSEAQGVTAFYDIDTPVTLAKLAAGDCPYLSPALISRYSFYLSFTGGPTLARLRSEFGSPATHPLYCCVDPAVYYRAADAPPPHRLLGYLGTYSPDRQSALQRLLIEPARLVPDARFAVAGPQYPANIYFPPNIERIEHLAPHQHRDFYTSQHATLNVTRAEMIQAGYSPSVRLFEAAACAVPVISDRWAGLEDFFIPGEEILLADTTEEMMALLATTQEHEVRAIGERARVRVLAAHTAAHRAAELEALLWPPPPPVVPPPAPKRGWLSTLFGP